MSYKNNDEDEVVRRIKEIDPDIFGSYEVEDSKICQFMKDRFPNYSVFNMGAPSTQVGDIANRATQEILIAVRNGKFSHVSFQQRLDFKEGNEYLRPGALLSVAQGDRIDSLPFLHTDSGNDASAFGNRSRMMMRALGLKLKLDQVLGGAASLLVLEDLNTMGLSHPDTQKANLRVSEKEEITGLAQWAQAYKVRVKRKWANTFMKMLKKDKSVTWTSPDGKTQTDLDQVLAAQKMKFAARGIAPDGGTAEVTISGWQGLKGPAFRSFVGNIFDHCSLAFEVR